MTRPRRGKGGEEKRHVYDFAIQALLGEEGEKGAEGLEPKNQALRQLWLYFCQRRGEGGMRSSYGRTKGGPVPNCETTADWRAQEPEKREERPGTLPHYFVPEGPCNRKSQTDKEKKKEGGGMREISPGEGGNRVLAKSKTGSALDRSVPEEEGEDAHPTVSAMGGKKKEGRTQHAAGDELAPGH